jgi:hypothetical protein
MQEEATVAIWDLAYVTASEDGDNCAITRLAVPGGFEAPQQAPTFVASLEEGASMLMRDGYEPFSASLEVDGFTQAWFRRQVQIEQLSEVEGLTPN